MTIEEKEKALLDYIKGYDIKNIRYPYIPKINTACMMEMKLLG